MLVVFKRALKLLYSYRVWLWKASKAGSSFVRMEYELKGEKKKSKSKTSIINDEMNADAAVREGMTCEDEPKFKVKERI